jgi:adenosine deaminase
MEAAYEGKCMAEYNLSVKVNFIVCGLRHLPASVTKSLAEIAWRFSDRGYVSSGHQESPTWNSGNIFVNFLIGDFRVVAFDLAGPEKGFSSKVHKEAFDLLRRKSVNLTLHR